jgi:DnaJ domain
MKTHYETLGVPATASQPEIRSAYLRQMGKYHPDRNPHPKATRIAAQLNEAYEVLSDAESRDAYDRELKERGQQGLSRVPVQVLRRAEPRPWIFILSGIAVLACITYLGVTLLARLSGETRLPSTLAPSNQPEAESATGLATHAKPARTLKGQPHLATGTPLQRPLDVAGHCELTVHNVTGADAVIYLVESSSHRIARSFYLQVGDSYTERDIAAGSYRIAFVTGRDWDAASEHFHRDAHVGPTSDILELSKDANGLDGAVGPCHYEIRLRLAGSWIEGDSSRTENR